MSETKISIHIDSAEKRKELPEVGDIAACPHCGGQEFSMGFGLAGGGYGIYEICDACCMVVSKTQESDE